MSASREESGTLGAAERGALLRLARAAIEDDLGHAGALDAARAAAADVAPLREARATFVTLRAPDGRGGEELRGCIGTLEAGEPLSESVVRNARRAAFGDPRFPPVTAEEMETISITVSVLTPCVEVASADEIEAGRDGVRLDLGPHRAVFLPEVARDRGWDRDELLRQLARKAGIPGGAWYGARLATFRTESFGERGAG